MPKIIVSAISELGFTLSIVDSNQESFITSFLPLMVVVEVSFENVALSDDSIIAQGDAKDLLLN